MNRKMLLGFLVIVALSTGLWYALRPVPKQPVKPAVTGTLITTVAYACEGGPSILASYYEGPSTPGDAEHPPVPGGSIRLVMSDGREIILPQTLSADGARYANPDESVVFWNKGNGATVNDGAATYTCVEHGE